MAVPSELNACYGRPLLASWIREFVRVFSHGSGLRIDSALARDRAQAIGPVFAKHGYVFLYLFRRGYGLSVGQGEFMGDILDREAKARGEEARRHLQVVLLATDHLDDAMAGLSALRSLAGVDSERIALVGHSFGGQLTLLAAERDKRVRAAMTFAAAAQSWEGSSELRERLLAALRNISAPIFLTHAANDYSTVPGQVMAAELARLGRSHQLKIYPAVGNTPAAGHEACTPILLHGKAMYSGFSMSTCDVDERPPSVTNRLSDQSSRRAAHLAR